MHKLQEIVLCLASWTQTTICSQLTIMEPQTRTKMMRMPSIRRFPSKTTKVSGPTSTLAITGDNAEPTRSFVFTIEKTPTSMKVLSTSSPTNSGSTWEMMVYTKGFWESCKTGTCLLAMAHSQ